MKTVLSSLFAAALFAATPASAQAGNFVIVNATGLPMTGLSVRHSGTSEWQPLTIVPLPVAPQARGSATFKNEDCAFDMRATLPTGETVVWTDVNLCQVKVVTLNRNARGELWADYQ
jgi:hypothetical protein